MQIVAIMVSLVITAVAVALSVVAVRRMVAVIRLGRPVLGRTDRPGARWRNCSPRPSGTPGCCSGTRSGSLHWFVFVAFGALSSPWSPRTGSCSIRPFALPIIGHWVVFEWWAEIFAWLT